jgi:hypothetical protein
VGCEDFQPVAVFGEGYWRVGAAKTSMRKSIKLSFVF